MDFEKTTVDYEKSTEYILPAVSRPDILRKAITTYGEKSQVDMTIEEMSELTKALLKHRRAENFPAEWDREWTMQNIHEEIADVVIMLSQLVMIYGGEDVIRECMEKKISRLEERLQDG